MNYRNPWKTLGTKLIYQNPWLKLREDKVLRPDGKPGIYSVVDTRIATGVIPLDDDLNTYLVGQYRYTLDLYSWEIVEGGTDEEEAPLDAIKRELVEEAGLQAEIWRPLGDVIHLSNCITSEEGFLFMAERLEECESNPDGTEELQVRKLPFREVIQMVEEGEITDAMSVIAVYRARRLLESEGRL